MNVPDTCCVGKGTMVNTQASVGRSYKEWSNSSLLSCGTSSGPVTGCTALLASEDCWWCLCLGCLVVLGLTNSILTTSAGLIYRQTLLLEEPWQIKCILTPVLKSLFQRHGWLVLCILACMLFLPWITMQLHGYIPHPVYKMLLHNLYNFYREDTTNLAMHVQWPVCSLWLLSLTALPMISWLCQRISG